MSRTTFRGQVRATEGFLTDGPILSRTTHKVSAIQTVTINVVDGAASGTFTLPSGAKSINAWAETATAIPGTPTNTNLRLGSAANGQQYVADVDVKAQGFVALTLLYAFRNPSGAIHFTVASSGGTAASQDGTILLHVSYI
jgi:hypothetical protein